MSDAPPKFITTNGVRAISPAWRSWKAQQQNGGGGGGAPQNQNFATSSQPPVPQMRNEMTALPVVSNSAEIGMLENGQATQGYQQAMSAYMSNAASVGLTQENAEQEINQALARFEIPCGLLNRMTLLRDMQELHFLNFSMNSKTDTKRQDGSQMTRWEEMQLQQERMLELLAYFITPNQVIRIIWMNNTKITSIQKMQGEPPAAFLQRSLAELRTAFTRTLGLTPAYALIEKSFQLAANKPTARFFFGDGIPSDKPASSLATLVRTRPNPRQNPFTFVACTNNDADVEWFGDVDEVSEFTAALDDFNDESRELLKRQGPALPFSYGVYLMCLLVGALDDVLDGLDEDTPLTLPSLSEILGYQMSEQEYQYYWNSFMQAQKAKNRRIQTTQDRIAANYLPRYNYDEFKTAARAKDIVIVQNYRREMKESVQGCCCVIA